MYRNQFVKKNGNFKTIRSLNTAPARVTRVENEEEEEVKIQPCRAHGNHIGTNEIRMIDYRDVGTSKVIAIEILDKIDIQDHVGMPIDYTEGDDDVASEGFKNCLLLPIYKPTNGSIPVQPHLDELQNMFQWMINSYDLKYTDPKKARVNTNIYPIELSQTTRTVIRKNTKEASYEYDLNILPTGMYTKNKYSGETYTVGSKKYPVVWLGYFIKDGEEYTPRFLKCYLKSYTIQELFVANGTVNEQGEFTATETDQSYSININTKSDMSINKNEVTNLVDVVFSDNVSLDKYEQPLVPGYMIKITEGEAQSIDILPIKNTAVQAQSVSQLGEPATGEEIIIDLTVKSDSTEILGKEYVVEEDEKNTLKRPKLSLIYNFKEDDIDENNVLKESVSKAICKKIKLIKGVSIEGAITVYQTAPTGDENSDAEIKKATLRYLSNVTLKNCLMKDEYSEEGKIEWFWFYNTLIDSSCDNEMKYYKLYNTNNEGEQLIGEDIFVGENGDGIMDPEVGAIPNNPLMDTITFNNLDDMYSWLTVPHTIVKNPASADAKSEIYTDETTKGTHKLSIKIGNKYLKYTAAVAATSDSDRQAAKFEEVDAENNVFLIYTLQNDPDTAKPESVNFYCCYVTTDNTSDFSITKDSTTTKYNNTYYGFLASKYIETFNKYLEETQEVASYTTNEVLTVTITSFMLEDNEKNLKLRENMVTQIDELIKIAERMPECKPFKGEVYGLMNYLLTFEETRLPSYRKVNDGLYGLDCKQTSSLVLVETTKTIEGKIKYIIEAGCYEWALSTSTAVSNVHADLVEKLRENNRLFVVSDEYSTLKEFLVSEKNYYEGVNTRKVQVSVEMIDAAELEIYEPENVYQVHYATEEEGVVVGLSVNGKMTSGVDNTVEFVQFFLKEIQGDVENYLHNKISKMEIDEFAAYVRPENSVNVSVDDRDKLIEYSQMMNTIQGQRDYIQKSGRSKSMFLLKFMQNAKGTYFEILGGEKDNYLAEEKVYGYYLSKGYGAGPNGSEGGDTDGSGSGNGSTGSCRYKSSRGNKRRREGISAIPSLNKYGNRFRITRMKEFYSQEPLDWRNDNYYSNQIYTLNADNLNVMIDPEFADKERVIVTKPSSNGSSEEMLQNTQEIRSEQEMLGFYRIKCTLSK